MSEPVIFFGPAAPDGRWIVPDAIAAQAETITSDVSTRFSTPGGFPLPEIREHHIYKLAPGQTVYVFRDQFIFVDEGGSFYTAESALRHSLGQDISSQDQLADTDIAPALLNDGPLLAAYPITPPPGFPPTETTNGYPIIAYTAPSTAGDYFLVLQGESVTVPGSEIGGRYLITLDLENTLEKRNAAWGEGWMQTVPPPGLFTNQNDIVDFNQLTTQQEQAIRDLIDTEGNYEPFIYNALGGGDEVTLPSVANAQLMDGVQYNHRAVFEAGSGNDTVVGSDADDEINAGGDNDEITGLGGNDTLRGERGNDTLDGGDGNDFLVGGLGNDEFIGGALGPTGTLDDEDTVRLKGSRDEYTITDDAASRTAVFVHDDGETDTLKFIERVVFDEGFQGEEPTGEVNFLLEMAKASRDAYGSEFSETSMWTPLHAHQLGLPLHSDTPSGVPGNWTFENGVFKGNPFGTDPTSFAAVAHIGEAVIDGRHTVSVAFRGTDPSISEGQLQDVISGWGPQVRISQWAAFAPLIEGLESYLDEDPTIQLLFSGHSLGGALAQLALEHFSGPGVPGAADVRVATFGAPGAPTSLEADTRIIHIEHSEDLVPLAGGSFLAELLGGFEKPGERVIIPIDDLNSLSDNGIGTVEHNRFWYVDSIDKLLSASPPLEFLTSDSFRPDTLTRVAVERENVTDFGGDIDSVSTQYSELFYGLGSANDIVARSGNDTIYGGAGNDTLTGGEGTDSLYGGSGSDSFKFGAAFDSSEENGIDTIRDFERGSDKIDLSSFSVGFFPDREFTFIDRAAFSGSEMQLRLTNSGADEVQVEGDTDGDREADFVLRVRSVDDLAYSDFIGLNPLPPNFIELGPQNGDQQLLDSLSDILTGTLEEHDGLTHSNFQPGDILRFENAAFDRQDLSITIGSAILAIDADRDGRTDATVTLAGDFSAMSFRVDQNGSDTEISVFEGNTPLEARDDAAATAEDTPVAINVIANDSDPAGQNLTISQVTDPQNGRVSFTGALATYTPNENFFGTDGFTYTVSDGTGGTDTATVRIDVASINDVPVAAPDRVDTGYNASVTVNVLGNDRDADGDDLVPIFASSGNFGSTVVNPDGTITYTPTAALLPAPRGADRFDYVVSDGNGDTASSTVYVMWDEEIATQEVFLVGPGVQAGTVLPGSGLRLGSFGITDAERAEVTGVTWVDLPLQDFAVALSDGRLDGVVVSGPFRNTVVQDLQADAVVETLNLDAFWLAVPAIDSTARPDMSADFVALAQTGPDIPFIFYQGDAVRFEGFVQNQGSLGTGTYTSLFEISPSSGAGPTTNQLNIRIPMLAPGETDVLDGVFRSSDSSATGFYDIALSVSSGADTNDQNDEFVASELFYLAQRSLADQQLGSPNSPNSQFLVGDMGRDRLLGGHSFDYLVGGSNNDTLIGNGAADTLIGGSGADRMEGGPGNDVYFVDDPNDIVVELGDDPFDAVATEVSYTLPFAVESLAGEGANPLSLTGNGLANRIFGGDGNDTLNGLSGDDVLTGNQGDDSLIGGTGTDTAVFSDPLELDGLMLVLLTRDAGGLTVVSREGTDFVSDDVEFLQFSGLTLSYAEALAASRPPPVIGDDTSQTLTGTPEGEQINGLGGFDWIVPGRGNDTVDGGADRDMVSYSDAPELPGRGSRFMLDLDLAAGTAEIFGGEVDQLISIERATGSIFADVLRGSDGDDELRGIGDYDWFVATPGRDTLDGGNGLDMVTFLEAQSSGTPVVQNIFATDGVPPTGAAVGGVLLDLANATNNAGLASGVTLLSVERVTGSSHQDVFFGDAGQNDFRGLGGFDWFVSSTGGRERYFGGDGVDTVTYFNAGSGVIASLRNGAGAFGGQETGYGSAGDAIRDLYFEIENLVGSDFDDRLEGNRERNDLVGRDGDDHLLGYENIDYLKGGLGNDTLNGGAGSDFALFDGNRSDYTLTRTSSTEVTITGADGTDSLISVEYFRFDDQTANIWELAIV